MSLLFERLEWLPMDLGFRLIVAFQVRWRRSTEMLRMVGLLGYVGPLSGPAAPHRSPIYPSRSRCKITSWAASSGVMSVVSMTISASVGTS
jgi:hypothetical protein